MDKKAIMTEIIAKVGREKAIDMVMQSYNTELLATLLNRLEDRAPRSIDGYKRRDHLADALRARWKSANWRNEDGRQIVRKPLPMQRRSVSAVHVLGGRSPPLQDLRSSQTPQGNRLLIMLSTGRARPLGAPH